jgi:hypothetical protein
VKKQPDRGGWKGGMSESAFRDWLATHPAWFGKGDAPQLSVKSILFLTLLDAMRDEQGPRSYKQLVDAMKKVVEGKVPDASVRTGLHHLKEDLDQAGHRLELRTVKSTGLGRDRVGYVLVKREFKPQPTEPLLILAPPAFSPDQIAGDLIENGTLPFHALYFLPRSACRWVAFSSEEGEERIRYEQRSWGELKIRDRLIGGHKSERMNMLSLGPGEGLGEVAILRAIFGVQDTGGLVPAATPIPKKVCYLAIDSSPVLLLDHIQTLRENFAEQLQTGELICAGVVADVFSRDGIGQVLQQVRTEFVRREVHMTEREFFPEDDCPTLVTYLGNNLGNDPDPDTTKLFRGLRDAIPNRPLEVLVGVSVKRNQPDKYGDSWYQFLLETPHHLLANMKLMESVPPTDAEREIEFENWPEFTPPPDGSKDWVDRQVEKWSKERTITNADQVEKHRKRIERFAKKCLDRPRFLPPEEPQTFSGNLGVKGDIYRFQYRLAFGLQLAVRLDSSARPRRTRPMLEAGREIVLYSIIKFDIRSLLDAIRRGTSFNVKESMDSYTVVTPNGIREYQVFSAFLDGKGGKQ